MFWALLIGVLMTTSGQELRFITLGFGLACVLFAILPGVLLKRPRAHAPLRRREGRFAQRSPYGRTRRGYAKPWKAFSKKCGTSARSTRSSESIFTRWRSSRPHPRNYSTTWSGRARCFDRAAFALDFCNSKSEILASQSAPVAQPDRATDF